MFSNKKQYKKQTLSSDFSVAFEFCLLSSPLSHIQYSALTKRICLSFQSFDKPGILRYIYKKVMVLLL